MPRGDDEDRDGLADQGGSRTKEGKKKKKQKIKSINYVIQKANADQITSELLWMENDSQDQVYDHHLVVVNNQVCMYNGAA